ncbi:MAG TPA: hypothetical protein VFQ84_07555 [Arenimonas sp.]|uniref:hypothetical protein n=1 Tax=Arenimonas sp. TaxID=1872635 RepID=UPI002D808BEF|nr:hypothetical protein [Arenimonas sp.]HEU0153183.1 hypothetical protein [Arenimonas sp.]
MDQAEAKELVSCLAQAVRDLQAALLDERFADAGDAGEASAASEAGRSQRLCMTRFRWMNPLTQAVAALDGLDSPSVAPQIEQARWVVNAILAEPGQGGSAFADRLKRYASESITVAHCLAAVRESLARLPMNDSDALPVDLHQQHQDAMRHAHKRPR